MPGEYHFKDVHSASTSEDGQNIVLNVTSPDGMFGISIPEAAIGRTCGLLLEASARARKITGSDTIQASEMQAFGLRKHQDPEKAIVTVTLQVGAAPLALVTTRKRLIGLARAILETEGQIDPHRPAGPPQ
jgi:hypothetical protein